LKRLLGEDSFAMNGGVAHLGPLDDVPGPNHFIGARRDIETSCAQSVVGDASGASQVINKAQSLLV
jgi:hypothetical protein